MRINKNHFPMIGFLLISALSPLVVAQTQEHPLDALFAGRAHFEEVRSIDFSAMNQGQFEGNTSPLVVSNGKWLAFNRRMKAASGCSLGAQGFEVAVRQTSDQGKSWSDAVVVLGPTKAYPCGLVDGAAFFDNDQQRWHYLGQCPINGRWNICHFFRNDPSPLGAFTADSANPVVTPGKIFSKLPGAAGFFDEGTPEILYKVGDYFYVTFHGYNGKDGLRAAARTKDFNSWETVAPGLPSRPMFEKDDCQGWGVKWNGGCIGTGHASTLLTPRYHYMLIEASDMNLACTPGQNWVLGLARADHLAGTGDWESYPLNPIVQNLSSKTGCGLQYQHLFEDNGVVYLYFGYDEPAGRWYPNQLYKIVSGSGPRVIQVNTPDGSAGLPAGSYSLSCSSCSMANSKLSCTCRDTHGASVLTQLDLLTCHSPSDLANINGHLQCQ